MNQNIDKALLAKWQAAIAKELPGYTIVPNKIKVRRGRPPEWELNQQIDLTMQFGELREELERIEGLDVAALTPKRKETDSKFYSRMSHVVEWLNRGCTLALRSYRDKTIKQTAIPAGFTGDASIWKELCQTKTRVVPLPEKIALQIAKLGWQTKRLRRDRLICALLAYHELDDPKKWNIVRRLVERGEADFPAIDSHANRRHSHSR